MSNVRISQLPTAPSAITGAELVAVVQNGQTVQTTIANIVASPSQTQTFLTVNHESTLPNSRYISSGIGIGHTDSGAQGVYSFYLNGTSGSLEIANTGIIAKTASNTITARTISVSGSGLSVTNGDGVSGNPTLAASGLLYALANASGTGLLTINGSNISNVVLQGSSNQISITNADGSAGYPTFSIATNPVMPGTASLTLPIGGVAARPVLGVNGMIRYNSDSATLEAYANNVWGAIISGSGVATFSAGSTGFTPNAPTSGGIVLSGTLNVANGGTGQTTASSAFNALSPITTAGDLILGTGVSTAGRLAIGANGSVLTSNGTTASWSTTYAGTVTSVAQSFTGGLISVAGSPITTSGTLALTVAGTSGGIPYFSSASTWATSAALAASALVIGGGAGVAPSTITTGTGVTTALGVNVGTAGAFVVNGGVLGTPSSGTVTNLTGTASININGTVGATTASTGAFTVLSTSSSTNTTPVLSFNANNSAYAAGATISGSYLQFLMQNKSGTAGASVNYVLSNDLGTDSSYYGEFGMNSSVFSASTPADFFSINNGIYFSGHDGDVSVGSGNGGKHYLVWGTVGQSAHVINVSGAIGLNTNLGTTPALSGTTNFGTSGQVLTSGGSSATPTWTTPNATTVTLANGSGATNYLVYAATATGNVAEYTSTGLTYNATNTAITGGINGGIF